jgi:hypothetical protein
MTGVTNVRTMEKREILSKPVYIFEDHNVGLAAWADIKANHETELILLTLDHHTDVHEAFIGWAYHANNRNMENVEPIIEQRLARVNVRDPQSVQEAVKELRNDEQIDAALRLGIFRLAFCFNNQHRNTRSIEEQQFSDSWAPGAIPPEPPFSYEVPKRKIFEIGEICAVGCERMPHNDDCLGLAANQAIESVMLHRLIDTANGMARSADIEDVIKVPYVLDIDLDYFRTKLAVSPRDPKVFHELLRNAVAITIATEPKFVLMERLDDVTSEYALERVVHHIEQALSAN